MALPIRLALPPELDVAPKIIDSVRGYRDFIDDIQKEVGGKVLGSVDLIANAASLAGPLGPTIAIAAFNGLGSIFRSLFTSSKPPPPPTVGGERIENFDDPLANVYIATIAGRILAEEIPSQVDVVGQAMGLVNESLAKLRDGTSWEALDDYLRRNRATLRALGAFCFYAGFDTLFNRDLVARESDAAQVGRIIRRYAARFQLRELYANYWLYRNTRAVFKGLGGNCNRRTPGFGISGNTTPIETDPNFRPGFTLSGHGAHKALRKACKTVGYPTYESTCFRIFAPYAIEHKGVWSYSPIPSDIFESEIAAGNLDAFDYWAGYRFKIAFGKDRSADSPSNMPETAAEVPGRILQMIKGPSERPYWDGYARSVEDMKERRYSMSAAIAAVRHARRASRMRDAVGLLKEFKAQRTKRVLGAGAAAVGAYFLFRR